MCEQIIKIRITYDEPVSLKDLSRVLDLINRAINEVNRELGLTNNRKLGAEYAAVITGVNSGSIVFEILGKFFENVAINVLANLITEIIKKLIEKIWISKQHQNNVGSNTPNINVINEDNIFIVINVNFSHE